MYTKLQSALVLVVVDEIIRRNIILPVMHTGSSYAFYDYCLSDNYEILLRGSGIASFQSNPLVSRQF